MTWFTECVESKSSQGKKDGDSSFYHNTMQTLHNLLGARKSKFAQISSCAKEIVYTRVCLRCWNFSVRFYERCERLLPLRVVGKYASNRLFLGRIGRQCSWSFQSVYVYLVLTYSQDWSHTCSWDLIEQYWENSKPLLKNLALQSVLS